MPKPKVNLLCPAQHANGTILPPGWYDREEVPESAFTCGFVYVPPAVPVPGVVPPTPQDNGEPPTQKQRGKTL